MRPFQAPRNRRGLTHPAPDDDRPAHPAEHLRRWMRGATKPRRRNRLVSPSQRWSAGDAKLVARDGDFKLMRGEAGHREAEPRASRLSAACRTRSRMQGG